MNLRGSEVNKLFLRTQAAAKQAGVQAERFGMGEEVECSGQKAGAGLALSCPERRVLFH